MMKFIIRVIIGIVGLAAFCGLFLVVFFVRYGGPGKCTYQAAYELPSLNKSWTAKEVIEECERSMFTPAFFEISRPGAPHDQKDVFLSGDDIKFPLNRYKQEFTQVDDIFLEWLDEKNLLVALPEGAAPQKALPEINGLAVHYEFYPLDADKVREETKKEVNEKSLSSEISFKQTDGYGMPGITCELAIIGQDKTYLDSVGLHLTADRVFPHRQQQPDGHVVSVKATFGALAQAGAGVTHDSSIHVTDVAIEGFAPKESRSYLLMMGRSLMKSGVMMSGFPYDLNNPKDVYELAMLLRQGQLKIDVSLWLENRKIIYTFEKPTNIAALDQFVSCIDNNHVFDEPN